MVATLGPMAATAISCAQTTTPTDSTAFLNLSQTATAADTGINGAETSSCSHLCLAADPLVPCAKAMSSGLGSPTSTCSSAEWGSDDGWQVYRPSKDGKLPGLSNTWEVIKAHTGSSAPPAAGTIPPSVSEGLCSPEASGGRNAASDLSGSTSILSTACPSLDERGLNAHSGASPNNNGLAPGTRASRARSDCGSCSGEPSGDSTSTDWWRVYQPPMWMDMYTAHAARALHALAQSTAETPLMHANAAFVCHALRQIWPSTGVTCECPSLSALFVYALERVSMEAWDLSEQEFNRSNLCSLRHAVSKGPWMMNADEVLDNPGFVEWLQTHSTAAASHYGINHGPAANPLVAVSANSACATPGGSGPDCTNSFQTSSGGQIGAGAIPSPSQPCSAFTLTSTTSLQPLACRSLASGEGSAAAHTTLELPPRHSCDTVHTTHAPAWRVLDAVSLRRAAETALVRGEAEAETRRALREVSPSIEVIGECWWLTTELFKDTPDPIATQPPGYEGEEEGDQSGRRSLREALRDGWWEMQPAEVLSGVNATAWLKPCHPVRQMAAAADHGCDGGSLSMLRSPDTSELQFGSAGIPLHPASGTTSDGSLAPASTAEPEGECASCLHKSFSDCPDLGPDYADYSDSRLGTQGSDGAEGASSVGLGKDGWGGFDPGHCDDLHTKCAARAFRMLSTSPAESTAKRALAAALCSCLSQLNRGMEAIYECEWLTREVLYAEERMRYDDYRDQVWAPLHGHVVGDARAALSAACWSVDAEELLWCTRAWEDVKAHPDGPLHSPAGHAMGALVSGKADNGCARLGSGDGGSCGNRSSGGDNSSLRADLSPPGSPAQPNLSSCAGLNLPDRLDLHDSTVLGAELDSAPLDSSYGGSWERRAFDSAAGASSADRSRDAPSGLDCNDAFTAHTARALDALQNGGQKSSTPCPDSPAADGICAGDCGIPVTGSSSSSSSNLTGLRIYDYDLQFDTAHAAWALDALSKSEMALPSMRANAAAACTGLCKVSPSIDSICLCEWLTVLVNHAVKVYETFEPWDLGAATMNTSVLRDTDEALLRGCWTASVEEILGEVCSFGPAQGVQ